MSRKMEDKMPERITIFTSPPHIKELWELCRKLGVSLNDLIKDMIEENYPIQKALLEKQLEQKEELKKLREKLKKGGDTKKN